MSHHFNKMHQLIMFVNSKLLILMDLYPIALALYGFLVIIALASLKSTMKELSSQERREKNTQNRKMIQNDHDTESSKKIKSESCKIFKYFIKNHTFILIFEGRRGTQLLSILFAYSVVGMFLYFTNFWYPAIGFSSIITITIIISQILQEKSIGSSKISEEQITTRWKAKKIIYVLIGITTVALYLTLIGVCFKNYINSQLKYMLSNFGIVFALDNLAVKPFLFLAIALITAENRYLINIIKRQELQQRINRVKVANIFEKQPETKHHFVINLEVQPEPIDQNKSKVSNKSRILQENIHYAPQALPSSSIIDTIQMHHEGSVQNMMSRVQSRKSGLNKLTSMKELNQIQLQKIEENPGYELQQYFCINVRKQKQQEENKQLENKMDNIIQNKSNVQTSQLIKQFILEDFVCCSPKIEENNHVEIHQQGKSSKYSKSKGSLRGAKTFRILERQNDVEINDKQNEESTKHQISQSDISKEHNYCSNRRIDNKTHILKISDTLKETGELQQIDINSPNKRAIQRGHYDTHVIPEETIKSKHKRNRRGTTKDISQPYLLQDKLIEVYFPGKNKSEFDNFIRSKKKNFDRSQFFNHSNKKEHSKGRQKPIVHQNDDQHTQFFVPKF